MAQASQPQVVLIERAEVHKSCKSLETVVNLFNDYCQAASAVTQLQKKLARALRDAAGCKATGEPPFNALNASAVIFETLNDIDSKMWRVLDKECDGISNDLRKWFKKLAKEEKAHDDRMQAVNAKIKAAGQAYERKTKKKATDAAEEHTKYMNLLTAVGPEMAQDKQNHATFVTLRHNAIVCGIAASISRAADAEWQRSCEGVRRFSPNIGAVGEWRAFCEAEWSGPIPADLPGPDSDIRAEDVERQPRVPIPSGILAQAATSLQTSAVSLQQESVPDSPVNAKDSSSTPSAPRTYHTSAQSPAAEQVAPPYPIPQTPTPLTRAATFADGLSSPAVVPLASSSLPSSPAPAPPTPSSKPPASDKPSNAVTLPPLASTASSSSELIATPIIAPEEPDEKKISRELPTPALDKGASPLLDKVNTGAGLGFSISQELKQTSLSGKPATRALSPPPAFPSHPTQSFASDRTLLDPAPPTPMSPPPRRVVGDQLEDRKVSPTVGRLPPPQMVGVGSGINQLQQHPTGGVQQQQTGGMQQQNTGADVNRRTSVDSTASGSIVAAMRDRYAVRPPPMQAPPSSPPPRDLPKLSHSVTDMATRWNPIDAPSPRRAGVNPAAGLENDNQVADSFQYNRGRPQSFYGQPQQAYDRYGGGEWDGAERRKLQLHQELQALEQEQRQHEELREREMELERQAAQLQQERQRLATLRSAGGMSDDSGYRSSSRTTSYQAQAQSAQSGGYMRPPSSAGSAYGARSSSPQPLSGHGESFPSYTSSASSSGIGTHLAAPPRNTGYSPNHYSNPPSPAKGEAAPLPGVGMQSTGKKGWMRRLSMPVVAGAFSSDTKKTPMASATMVLPPADDRLAKRSFEKDGVGSFGHRRDNYAGGNSLPRR